MLLKIILNITFNCDASVLMRGAVSESQNDADSLV